MKELYRWKRSTKLAITSEYGKLYAECDVNAINWTGDCLKVRVLYQKMMKLIENVPMGASWLTREFAEWKLLSMCQKMEALKESLKAA